MLNSVVTACCVGTEDFKLSGSSGLETIFVPRDNCTCGEKNAKLGQVDHTLAITVLHCVAGKG